MVTIVGGKNYNFPTDRCKCPTGEIMGAQNFNFGPKFLQNREFPNPNVVFLDKNSDKKKGFRQAKILGVGIAFLRSVTTPLKS